MKNENIIDYINGALKEIKDTDERKRALISIVSNLIDKGILDFQEDKEVAYIDNLELVKGTDLQVINEAIDNDATVKANREKRTKTIPPLRGVYDLFLYPVDNITKTLFRGDVRLNQPKAIKAIGARKAEDSIEKSVYVTLKDLGIEDIVKRDIYNVQRLLNADDRLTLCGICNLMEYGFTRVTPKQLYCVAVRNPDATPTEEQLKRQDESIRKMAMLYIRLNTKEIMHVYPGLSEVVTGGQFIKVTEYYGRTANGTFSDYYEFDGMPIIFKYAKIVNQVLRLSRIDKSLLDSPLRRTKENEEFIQLIADRVTSLTNKKVPSKITWESIFARMGIDFSTYKNNGSARNKKARTKEGIRKHLNYLQGIGKIGGFNELEDGIEIYL